MNKVAPAVSVAFGLYWMYMAITQYGLWFNHGPGGGVFPLVAGIIVTSFGGTLLVRTIRKDMGTKGPALFDIRAVKVVVIAVITLVIMYFVGMTIALLISLFCWLKFFEKKTVLKSLAISVGTLVILYAVFGVLLRIPLPTGLLGIL